MKHPPGPYGHLILGNLHDLRTRVLEFFSGLRPKYGDISTIRFSVRKVSYVQNPDYIHYILQVNNRNYTKSLRYEQLKYLLGNGLLTSEGEFWLRQRRMIQPAFHKHTLQLLAVEMVECTNEMLIEWQNHDAEQPFNVSAQMMAITLQIVGKTLMNADVKSEARNVGDALSFLLRAVNVRTRTPVLLPLWIPIPHHLKISKAVKTINQVLDRIFEERRAHPTERYDLLSLLMGAIYEDTGEHMGNKQLRDEVMTIFMAGHETTANALSWTLYLLATHRDILNKCTDEIMLVCGKEAPSFSDLSNLKYLSMVIEESMRLYPPAWVIGRKSIKSDQVGPYKIPAGHNILISPYALHRDERYWPEPDKFIPERFSLEEIKKRPRNVYMPFGAGPRMCIGNNFAIMEMQIVLAMIMQRFTFSLAVNEEITPEPLITLRPQGGVWLRLLPVNYPVNQKNQEEIKSDTSESTSIN